VRDHAGNRRRSVRCSVQRVRSVGLNHVAMSFAPGTLTEPFRSEVREFYGDLLDWTEIEELRLTDRMTLATGRGTYLNLRERDEVMVCHGYEHVGVTVRSPEDAEQIHTMLEALDIDVELGELNRGDDGYRSFRFRHLLPLAIEIQFIPG